MEGNKKLETRMQLLDDLKERRNYQLLRLEAEDMEG